VLAASVVALVPHLAFFLLFWSYALFSPLRSLIGRARRGRRPAEAPRLD